MRSVDGSVDCREEGVVARRPLCRHRIAAARSRNQRMPARLLAAGHASTTSAGCWGRAARQKTHATTLAPTCPRRLLLSLHPRFSLSLSLSLSHTHTHARAFQARTTRMPLVIDLTFSSNVPFSAQDHEGSCCPDLATNSSSSRSCSSGSVV